MPAVLPPLRRIRLLFALALAACGKKTPPPAPVEPDNPVLPAMEADVYARGAVVPGDVRVAAAAMGRDLDEALSGGAAAMALDAGSTGFSLPMAQWAAWRAGYPFAVVLGAIGMSGDGSVPSAVQGVLGERVQAGQDLGLARARVGDDDRWVALVGQPIDGVPSFASRYEEGGTLDVALPAASTWTLVSPEGEATEGEGPIHRTLDHFGEWWLDARLPGGGLSLPLYAGMAMPPTPVLPLPGQPAAGPDDARAQAYDLLAVLREDFDLPVLVADPMLETLGEQPLQALVAGTWQRDAGVERLRAAGFTGASADELWCRAPTVSQCLEGLMRTGPGRVALLDPALSLAGVQARVEAHELTLLIDLASEG